MGVIIAYLWRVVRYDHAGMRRKRVPKNFRWRTVWEPLPPHRIILETYDEEDDAYAAAKLHPNAVVERDVFRRDLDG